MQESLIAHTRWIIYHLAIIGDSSEIISDGKRFIVRADEKLTAFLELEAAIRGASVKLRKFRLSNSICAARQPSRAKPKPSSVRLSRLAVPTRKQKQKLPCC